MNENADDDLVYLSLSFQVECQSSDQRLLNGLIYFLQSPVFGPLICPGGALSEAIHDRARDGMDYGGYGQQERQSRAKQSQTRW